MRGSQFSSQTCGLPPRNRCPLSLPRMNFNKPEQIHFLDRFGRDIAPHLDRGEPLLWFQELRLFDKLAPGVTLIRGFRFKRGLNVLWAEPEDPATNEGLYRDGLAGHATGKTLF